MEIEKAIVPITFLDDVEYNADNDKKHLMGNLNELFINPYNINTLYRPITTVEPTDRIIGCYNDSIKKSKIAYIQMNVEDLVINSLIEFISDITEETFNGSEPVIRLNMLLRDKFISNLYIHNIIGSELENIEYIDITLCNLYTRIVKDIIDPFVVQATMCIMKYYDVCQRIYAKYVDDRAEIFDNMYNSLGNTVYCNISSLLRDIAEVKMSNIRSLFDVIKQTYLNMGQFASDYHIDPESYTITSGDSAYYSYLKNHKYNIEENSDV